MKALRAIRSEALSDSGSSSQPSTSAMSRMSFLPSVKIPLFRRSDNDAPPSHMKDPLLTVKLSSLSFLDSSVFEITSQTTLYTITTTGTSTTVSRNDPRRGPVKVTVLKWPRVLPSKPTGKDATECVLVQMRSSRWDLADKLLKPAANSIWKFNVPNYSQSMKWKQHGSTYWCTTASVKGPIAIMDRGNHTEPTKITVFETLHDKYDPKALSAMHGVSVILLDYLLVTALLLVTDLQEWMLVKKFEDEPNLAPSSTSVQATSSAPDLPSTSESKLRKIFYGEPIFPKLSATESRSKHSSSSTGPMTPVLPQTPTTPNFGTLTMTYAESCFTSSRPSSPRPGLPSIAGSDSNEYEAFSLSEMRSNSPLPESVHFNSRPPSHNYFDPSFYGSQDQPPVPPIPLKYAKSFNERGAHSQPATPFALSRELTHSPVSEGFPRTTLPPSLEETSDSRGGLFNSSQSHPTTRAERSNSVRSSMSNVSQATSSGRRPLPRPPTAPAAVSAPTARRVQSSSQLRSDAGSLLSPMQQGTLRAPTARVQRSLPPTPSISPLRVQYSPNSPPSTSSTSTPAPPEPDAHLRIYPASPTLLSPDSPPEAHSRAPPITKASQEDLRDWVHSLTNPRRDLPPDPLPSSSIYDVPPPAYETINFSRKTKQDGSSRHRTEPSS
ncbi:hypothetical protein BDN70DRAFT_895237 [Pholiota conissans]|uniref:Uncharacterized protein n=1 Tax=Pholiota conissans TaxID=109636 RepID=A0A9P5Z075_9AGAR|nr:hypothetical protein BDN70DRAFT_895237 [Pholiota conissans]